MKKYVADDPNLSDEEYYDQYYDTQEYRIDRQARYIETLMDTIQDTSGENYEADIDRVAAIMDEMYSLASELGTYFPAIIRH